MGNNEYACNDLMLAADRGYEQAIQMSAQCL